jgi:putative membrane protein insertion efficiency factor
MTQPLRRALPLALALYRRVRSPVIHAVAGSTAACRFQPTCSEYAALALATHGAARGGWLALRRLLRCRPGGGSGFDPVPGTGFDAPSPNAMR